MTTIVLIFLSSQGGECVTVNARVCGDRTEGH